MSLKKIRCPHCKNWADWADNPYRPFCSKHCKTIDLGNWASENYRIATENKDEEEDGAPPSGLPKREED